VETSSEGIWQLDQENTTVFVNPRMAEMLGYSLDEMFGKSFLDFLMETDKKAVDYLLGQLQDLILQPYDVQFRRQDGSILWGMVSSRSIFDESGEYLGRLKMVTDISDRKQAEAELQSLSNRLELALRSAAIGCWEWDIPNNIASQLRRKSADNNLGEIIKVLMITSAGSEGINLRNTRFVHIMEPYWHPVRLEQVIGRARRICSHKDLPLPLQTVEVFIYIMIFSEEQLKSDEAIELKRKDLSKGLPHLPITSDQYLFEISEIKANLTSQLTDAIKESAFDCYIYSNGKCVNFGDPTNDKFSYVPDYAEQQNDTTVKANKVAVEWVGKSITINGVEYVYRRVSKNVLDLYDKKIYTNAMNDVSIVPLKVGTYEVNERGEKVVKLLVI
jgi:PAS domain S-box-containing protein